MEEKNKREKIAASAIQKAIEKKKLKIFFFYYIKLWAMKACGKSRKKYFYVYISAVSVIYLVTSIGCRPNDDFTPMY